MSNLSDLLPAGGGAKVITATADGNLATGQTVILQSNGTVKAVEATAAGLGSEAVFESGSTTYSHVVYDSYNDKLVVFYQDAGDSGKGKAAVGTVTGNSISWGTPVQFSTGNDVSYIGGTYDPDTYKVIVVYKDGANSNYGTANVGTVSGTSISFGTKVVYESASVFWNAATYETAADKVVVAYRDAGDSNKGKAIVGTVSGTSISFGSATDIDGGEANRIGITFDSTANKVLIIYQGTGIEIISGTVSGTSISFGVSGQLDSSGTGYPIGIAYNSTDDNFLVAWGDGGSSYLLTIQAGNTSGSGFAVGSAVTVSGVNVYYPWLAYDSGANIYNLVYNDASDSNKGKVVPVTVSGTTPSVGTAVVFNAASSDYITSVYNSSAKNTAIVYQDGGNSNYGTGIIWANAGTTSDNFVGITNQAINNSASGEVVVEGGVITNSSLVPDVPAISVGTAGDTSDKGQHMAAAYDANAQRVVTFYRDSNNSNYGTSAVGTVSSTSITFGTPVVFNSASTTECTAAYNSTAQKVMVAFNSAGSTGKAIYGAVSGTTIDFSSYTVTQFDSNNISEMQVVFDTNAEKMVIAYKLPGSESQLGKAVVGTLSGTTLSFGTAVTFNNAATEKVSAAYDSTNNKVVILYQDSGNSNYPTAIVGTVSGTSISFGSETALSSSAASWNTISYDSGNQKIVAAYRDDVVEDLKVAVGTVSGTSISFATPVSFNVLVQWLSSAYDPDNGIVLFNFKNQSGNAGTCVPAIIDGTSFSFGSSVVFETGSTEYTSTVYDTNADKFVVAFNDGGASDQGRAVVQTSSKTVGLTIGSTYYVQDDGSLSTTSSSVTAGKAIANTTLLLKG